MCDPGLLPEDKNEQSSQMSSLDLYEDLLVSENQGDVNRVLSMQEIVAEKRLLEEQNKKLLRQLAEMQQKSQNSQAEKQNIQRNFNSLLATAKVELARKNKLLSHYVGSSRPNRTPAAKSIRKPPNQVNTKQKKLLMLYKGSRVDDRGPAVKQATPALLQHRGEKMVGVATKVFSNSCDKNTTMSATISQSCSITDTIQNRINENQGSDNRTSLSGRVVSEQLEQNVQLESPGLVHANATVINHENNALESHRNANFSSGVSVSKEQYSVELYDRPCSSGKHLLSETTRKLQTRLNEDRPITNSVLTSSKHRNVCKTQSLQPNKISKKNVKTKSERSSNQATVETSNLYNKKKSSVKLLDTSLAEANQQTTGCGGKEAAPRKAEKGNKRPDKIRDKFPEGKSWHRGRASQKSLSPPINSCATKRSASKQTLNTSHDRSCLLTQGVSISADVSVKSEEKETARKTKHSIKEKTTGKLQPSQKRCEDGKKEGMPNGSFDLRTKLTTKKQNHRPELSANGKFCSMTRKISVNADKQIEASENDLISNNLKCVNKESEQEIVKGVTPETFDQKSKPEAEYITIDEVADGGTSQEGTTDYLNFHGDDDLDYDEDSIMHRDLTKLDHAEVVKDKAETALDDVAKSPPVIVHIHSLSGQVENEFGKNSENHEESLLVNSIMSVTVDAKKQAGKILKKPDNKKSFTEENNDPSYQPCVQLVDIAKFHLRETVLAKRKISDDIENESHCINKKRKETVSSSASELKNQDLCDSDTTKFPHNNTCVSHDEKLSSSKDVIMKSSDSGIASNAHVNFLVTDSSLPDVRKNLTYEEKSHSSVTPMLINSSKAINIEQLIVNGSSTPNANYDIDGPSLFQTPAKQSCSSVVHAAPAFNTRSKKKLDSMSLVSDLRMMLEGDKKLSSLNKSKEEKVKDKSQSSNISSLNKVKMRLKFDGTSVENKGRKFSDVLHETENKSDNLTERHTEAADKNAIKEKTKNFLNQQNISTDVNVERAECSALPFHERPGFGNMEIATANSSTKLDVAMEIIVKTTPAKKMQIRRTNSDAKIKKNSAPGTLKIEFKGSSKKTNCKNESEKYSDVKERHVPNKNLQNDTSFSNIVIDESNFVSDNSLPVGSFEPSPELNKWLASGSKNKNDKKQKRKRKKRKKHNINKNYLRQFLSSSDEEGNNTCLQYKIDSCKVSDSFGFDVENSKNRSASITDSKFSNRNSMTRSSEVKFVPSTFPELDATQHIDDAMCFYKNAALQFLLYDAKIRLDALTASFTEEPLDLSLGRSIQTSEQLNTSKDYAVLTNFSPLALTSISPTDAAGCQKLIPEARPHTDTIAEMTTTEEKFSKCQNTTSFDNQKSGFAKNSINDRILVEQDHVPALSCQPSQQEDFFAQKDISLQKAKNIPHSTHREKPFNNHRMISVKKQHISPKRKTSLAIKPNKDRQSNTRLGEDGKHTRTIQTNTRSSEHSERKHMQHRIQSTRMDLDPVKRRQPNRRKSGYYDSLQYYKDYQSQNHYRHRLSASGSRCSKERGCFSRYQETQNRDEDHRSRRSYYHRDGKPLKKRDGGTTRISKDPTGCLPRRSHDDNNWDQLLKERSEQQRESSLKVAERQKPSLVKKKPRRVALERVDLSPTEKFCGSDKKVSPPSRNLWMSSLKDCQERRKKRARWSSDVCESELSHECLQASANKQFIESRNAVGKCNEKDTELKHISSDRTSQEAAASLSETSRNALPIQSEVNVQHPTRLQDNFESRSSSHMSVVIPELSASSWQLSEESRAQFYSFAKVIKMLSPLKSSPGKQRLFGKGTPKKKERVRRRVLPSS